MYTLPPEASNSGHLCSLALVAILSSLIGIATKGQACVLPSFISIVIEAFYIIFDISDNKAQFALGMILGLLVLFDYQYQMDTRPPKHSLRSQPRIVFLVLKSSEKAIKTAAQGMVL